MKTYKHLIDSGNSPKFKKYVAKAIAKELNRLVGTDGYSIVNDSFSYGLLKRCFMYSVTKK